MTLNAFLICEFAALILGLLNAFLFSFRSRSSRSYALTMAILPPVVTIVIMLVNGNIGAGLGVAGAFALVRFRSFPGTAKEIAGLFLSVAIGLACGMGFVGIAAIFFAIMAALILALTLLRFGESSATYRLLKITIPETLDYDGLFDDLFEKYTSQHELIYVKTTNMGTLYELCYEIHLRSVNSIKPFIDDIRCRNGNLNVMCSKESNKEMM